MYPNEELIFQARLDYNQGRYKLAQNRIETFLEQSPNHVNGLVVLAQICIERQLWKDAEKHILAAIELDRLQPLYNKGKQMYNILGDIYVGQGRYNKADSAYQQYEKENPFSRFKRIAIVLNNNIGAAPLKEAKFTVVTNWQELNEVKWPIMIDLIILSELKWLSDPLYGGYELLSHLLEKTLPSFQGYVRVVSQYPKEITKASDSDKFKPFVNELPPCPINLMPNNWSKNFIQNIGAKKNFQLLTKLFHDGYLRLNTGEIVKQYLVHCKGKPIKITATFKKGKYDIVQIGWLNKLLAKSSTEHGIIDILKQHYPNCTIEHIQQQTHPNPNPLKK